MSALLTLGIRLVHRPAFWGIVIRLLLMPIACHYDLLSYYWSAHGFVYHQENPYAGHPYGELYFFTPFIYVYMGWLWLIRPLLGPQDLWSHTYDWFPGLDVYQINDSAWHAFVSAPNIGLILFLFKVPYLLCEWWMIRALCATKTNPVERTRMATFLWLNPVSIFAIYILGCEEPFAALFLAFGLFWAFKQRHIRAAWLVGVSAVFRLYPVLFFPLFAFLFGKRRMERLRLLAIVSAPLLFMAGIAIFHYPGTLALLSDYRSANYLLAWEVPLYARDALYPYVIGYVLVVCLFWARGGRSLERWVDASLIMLLLFYATAFFHPQYFFWCIPLLAFRMASRPELMRPFAVQVLCYAVYTIHWGRPMAGYLFASLNPDFFMALRAPAELIAPFCPPEKIVALAHSALSGVSLWMSYLLLRGTGRGRVLR